MTQPRLHVLRNIRAAVSPTCWALLNDDPLPENFNKWEVFSGVAVLWPQFRDDILTNWISTKPGTRPSCWWRHDAPEPRQRIAGVGTPDFEMSAYQPSYKLGVPDGWSDDVDPNDPPRYESQASYLARHKLLAPGEAKRLKKADFLPEAVAKPENLENSDVD